MPKYVDGVFFCSVELKASLTTAQTYIVFQRVKLYASKAVGGKYRELLGKLRIYSGIVAQLFCKLVIGLNQ